MTNDGLNLPDPGNSDRIREALEERLQISHDLRMACGDIVPLPHVAIPDAVKLRLRQPLLPGVRVPRCRPAPAAGAQHQLPRPAPDRERAADRVVHHRVAG